MKKIIIPEYEGLISNRLDCSKRFMLYNIENGEVKSSEIIIILERNTALKIERIIEINFDIMICNGITEHYYRKLIDRKIKVIPWISGKIEDVLQMYLAGKLKLNSFNRNAAR